MVIRRSRVSTFTRRVWLAILPSDFSSSPAGALSPSGWANLASSAAVTASASGPAVSRNARSSSSRPTSPTRSGRSSCWKGIDPAAAGGAGAGARGSVGGRGRSTSRGGSGDRGGRRNRARRFHHQALELADEIGVHARRLVLLLLELVEDLLDPVDGREGAGARVAGHRH